MTCISHLSSLSIGKNEVTRHVSGNYSSLLGNLLPVTISDYEKGSTNFVAKPIVFSTWFLWSMLLHYSAISFGEFSRNLQTMFKHNFSLRSSVICPEKIRNCLFLTSITSVNISSRVGKMFVYNYLIVCLLWSFLVSFLLISTYFSWLTLFSFIAFQLLFMFWWILHLFFPA